MPSFIAALFTGHDPFRQLKQHMDHAQAAARELGPLFDALLADDQVQLKEVAKRIFALELQADEVKHELRLHLPRTLMLAINRADLLRVLHHQDSIADRAEDVAGLLLQRSWPMPDEVRAKLPDFVRQVIDVVDRTHAVVHRLDDLVGVGFSNGPLIAEIEQQLTEINRTESACDKAERAILRDLFAAEESMSPVSVVMWYRLIEWVGDVADGAERCANQIRLTIAQ